MLNNSSTNNAWQWTQIADDTCGNPEHVLRHERELGTLAAITKTLVNQNEVIANSLNTLNETVTDFKVIISQQQENIKGFIEVKEELTQFNNTVIGLKTAIADLKDDLKDRNDEIKDLQVHTSHTKWLNSSIKTVADNAGVILTVSILILLATHWTTILKFLSAFKG